jgi:hypothetical protein
MRVPDELLTVTGRTASGTIDGRRVSVEVENAGRGGWFLVVRSLLDPPLDLGLDIQPRTTASVLEPEPFTGHPDLDAEFTASADEVPRARQLFTVPLCNALAALYRQGFEPRLDDFGCTIISEGGSILPDIVWRDRAISGAIELVSFMDEARAHLAPADRLREHAAALRGLAGRHHLPVAISTAPLRACGMVEGRALEVGAARTGACKYHLYARGDLEGDLAVGLSLRRRKLLDDVRTFLGAQEVLVGDASLLDHAVRTLLLSLDERCGAVAADDRSVTIDPIPLDLQLDELIIIVEVLIEMTGRISHNLVHGGAEAGPYR